MILELPQAWVIVLNVLGWPLIHLGVAWAVTQVPSRLFREPGQKSVHNPVGGFAACAADGFCLG